MSTKTRETVKHMAGQVLLGLIGLFGIALMLYDVDAVSLDWHFYAGLFTVWMTCFWRGFRTGERGNKAKQTDAHSPRQVVA